MRNTRQFSASLTWILVIFLAFGLFRLFKEVRLVMSYLKDSEVKQQVDVEGLLATTTIETKEVVSVEASSTPFVVPEDFIQYQNIGYGFSLYYPKLWTVKDSSYTYEGEPNAFVVLASPPVIVSDDKGVTRVYFELCLDLSSRETIVNLVCRGFKRYAKGDTGEASLPKNAFSDRLEATEAKNIIESIRTLDTFRGQEDAVLFSKPIWNLYIEKPQGWTVLHDTDNLFELYSKTTNDKISLSLETKDISLESTTLKELLPFSKDTGKVFKDLVHKDTYFLILKNRKRLRVVVSKEELLQKVVLEMIQYKNKTNEK